ncbi:MAG: hypothetical protein HYU75_08995 [Betaproteobacteria bacterium]|nr:hypothetical protein [Betaproteobacteria bacterium]
MDRIDMLIEPARAFLGQIGIFLPRLALAGLVLVGGWLAAKALRFAVERGMRSINFNVLTERAGLDGFLQRGGVGVDTTGIFELLAYWVVILAALIIAFNSLGLTYITDLLRQLVLFVPRLIVALVLLALGAYFARFMGSTVATYCRNVGMQDAELLGRISRYAILTFVVLIALDQVGVGGDIVRESFLILLAGVVFGLALAFGLGGRARAEAMLEHWWPSRGKDDKR